MNNLPSKKLKIEVKHIAELKSKDITDIVDDESKTIDDVFKRFERINNDIKFKAFGKMTLKDKNVNQDKKKLR